MADPTAQETFERMVRDEIRPFLRERAFKRSNGTFHRAVGAHWQGRRDLRAAVAEEIERKNAWIAARRELEED